MSVMKDFLDSSYLFGGNSPFIEELYESWLDNPQSVPEQWCDYFDKLRIASGQDGRDVAHAPVVQAFAQRATGRAEPYSPAFGAKRAHALV